MKPLTPIILFLCLLALPAPNLATADEIVINAVGDLMLAGRWTPVFRERGYDFPFDGVRSELAAGDFTMANLEAPIANGGTEFTGKRFRFRADPELVPALKRARINMVNLANNHIMDFGDAALTETIQHLDAAGIGRFGAGMRLPEARRAAILTVRGKRVAFLGYSLTQPTEFFAGKDRPGTAPGFEKHFVRDIAEARTRADYVIVSFHWGTEGRSGVQEYQRSAARAAITAGADVIIGHHPHVLRGIERYGRGIVFYSLGNFAFASKGRTADAGAMVRLRFAENRREAEIMPMDTLYRRVGFQPRLLSGERAGMVIGRLNQLSKPMKTVILQRDGRYVVAF